MPVAYLKLMRPQDWVKNVFILPAIVFSLPAIPAEERGEVLPIWIADTVLVVLAFGLLASGFYAINDALDADRDRHHPRKRHRPIAAGLIAPNAGIGFGVMIGLAGLALGFIVDPAVGGVLVGYLVLQILYNAGFKRIAIVDAVVLATGFAMRSTVGAFAIDRPVSTWLLGCVFFLTLYLAFIKRMCDLAAAKEADTGWTSPAGYDDRFELNWLLGISAVTVVLCWVLYTLSPHAADLFGIRASGLALLTPFVVIVVHRFYRRANLGARDSPIAAIREDPVISISLTLFLIGLFTCLYAPGADELLGRLIFPDTGVASPG